MTLVDLTETTAPMPAPSLPSASARDASVRSRPSTAAAHGHSVGSLEAGFGKLKF
jgi:hypothetical protein